MFGMVKIIIKVPVGFDLMTYRIVVNVLISISI